MKNEYYRAIINYWKNAVYSQPQLSFSRSKEKILRFGKDLNIEPGKRQFLSSEDGFPWCAIDESYFKEKGLELADIDKKEAIHILQKGFSIYYQELLDGSLIRFNPFHLMGLYLNEEPAGFCYGGIVTSWKDNEGRYTAINAGELGLVHVTPDMQNKGLGTLLNDLLDLRLLSYTPYEMSSTVSDKSGKIKHLLKEVGFLFQQNTPGSGYPKFTRNLSTENDRSFFQKQLTDRVQMKLQGL